MAAVTHSFNDWRVEQQRQNVLVRAACIGEAHGILDASQREVAQQYLLEHLVLDDLRMLLHYNVCEYLDKHAAGLAECLSTVGDKSLESVWGPARQTVNLAMVELCRRHVVYVFCHFDNFEAGLEVPLDRCTMTFIQRETEERFGTSRPDLVPVDISALTHEVNERFQTAAQEIVKSVNKGFAFSWEDVRINRTDIDQYALSVYLGKEAN